MAAGVPNVSSNDAIAARNFAIEIDGTTIAQFTEVGGLTSEMDVTELKENGPDGNLIFLMISLPSGPFSFSSVTSISEVKAPTSVNCGMVVPSISIAEVRAAIASVV